jgi:SAM-dependent methyltransferase
MRTFEDLIAEGASVPTEGWDFSWFAGRATEQRPSWGYARLVAARMATVTAALDLQTGGGEVLAGVPKAPPLLVATESWQPNLALAAARLGLRGGRVVAAVDAALPFAGAAFDLVVSRHPVDTCWLEVARVLRPGGTFLSQQIGAGTMRELAEAVTGVPHPPPRRQWHTHVADRARAAGLTVTDLRYEELRAEFFDVAAVVHFLRKVVWTVPDFTVEKYRDGLASIDRTIRADGSFVAYSRRFLIEARKAG